MSTEGTIKKLDDVPARALGRRTGMISQHHRRGFQHTAGPLDLTPISGPRFGPRDSEKRAKVISPSIDKGPRGVDSTETQYQDAAFHVNPRPMVNLVNVDQDNERKGASKKLDNVIHANGLIGRVSKARVCAALSTDSKCWRKKVTSTAVKKRRDDVGDVPIFYLFPKAGFPPYLVSLFV